MEKGSRLAAVVFSIVLLFIMVFITGYAVLMVALMGGIQYVALVLIISLLVYVAIVLYMFHFFWTKRRKRIFASFAGVALLAGAISPIQHAYKSNIPTVDAEIDVYAYQPFADGSRVVTLDKPAELKLSDRLPKMDGATALYPLYSAFVQATYPEKEYNPYHSEVMVNTTPEAYQNLFDGKVDMIFAAGPSDAQVKMAEQKGLELKMTPIGREAFVFFVHQKNAVDGLTVAEVKDIYSGKVRNWKEVGGADDSIRAFQRPKDSGSQTALERLMGDTPIMEAPTENISSGMGGIINEVSQYRNYKNAIGYTFRFYSTEMVGNDQIKLLELEGVAPTKETIRSGAYPIASEFYIVTARPESENVRKFIDWILSDEGQGIVEKVGYVPVRSE